MYFDEASQREPMQVGVDSRILMTLNGIAILALGIMPGALLAICERAIGLSLRVAT